MDKVVGHVGSVEKLEEMEFLIRWDGYSKEHDSYISFEAAKRLTALREYMAKKRSIFGKVFDRVSKETVTRAWVGLNEEEGDMVGEFMGRAKLDKTWEGHRKNWSEWIAFLDSDDRVERWGNCLEKCGREGKNNKWNCNVYGMGTFPSTPGEICFQVNESGFCIRIQVHRSKG